MIAIRATDIFEEWLRALRDDVAKARIVRRIDRLRFGNFGDVKPVGDGISELRIDHGPDYRVYFIRKGSALVILLCGGDKGSQTRDIAAARRLAAKERSS